MVRTIFVVRQVGLHARWEFEAGRVAAGAFVSVHTLGWAYHSIIFERLLEHGMLDLGPSSSSPLLEEAHEAVRVQRTGTVREACCCREAAFDRRLGGAHSKKTAYVTR